MKVKMHEPVAFEGTLEPRAWPCFVDYSPLQPLIVLICVVEVVLLLIKFNINLLFLFWRLYL